MQRWWRHRKCVGRHIQRILVSWKWHNTGDCWRMLCRVFLVSPADAKMGAAQKMCRPALSPNTGFVEVAQHGRLLVNIVPGVLEFSRRAQDSVGTQNVPMGTFTGRWFRDSGLYDLRGDRPRVIKNIDANIIYHDHDRPPVRGRHADAWNGTVAVYSS